MAQITLSFDDGKAPDAMRTIGEVADALGIKQHILRYWEQQFPMLKPLKRSGGRRLYRPEDVQLVATINRLVNGEGYTIRGAVAALKTGQAPAVEASQPQMDRGSASEQLVSRLKDIRRRLSAALEAA
jgi:DNA-binding transcriptional MerR regulator